MTDVAETRALLPLARRRPAPPPARADDRRSSGPGGSDGRPSALIAHAGIPDVAGHLLIAAVVVLALALGGRELTQPPAAVGAVVLAYELLASAAILRWSRSTLPLIARAVGDTLLIGWVAHVSGGILSPAIFALALVPVGLAVRVSPPLVAATSAIAVSGAAVVCAVGDAAPGADPLGRLALVTGITGCSGLAAALVAHEYRRRLGQIEALSRTLDELMTEVLTSEVRQRHEVAERLHDDLMQILLAVRQDIAEAGDSDAEGLRLATDHLDTGLQRLRATVETLGGRDPRDQPFDDAVRDTAQQHVAGRRSLVVAQVSGTVDPLLRPVLLTFVRDLTRHASHDRNAEHVAIRIAAADDAVTIGVFDDGDDAVTDGAQPDALARCRRRARAIGAELTVEDEPAAGRRISVRLPGGSWPR